MSNPPTLVFVPGSWHLPSCYTKIIKLLSEDYKLKCIAITLPSTTGNPSATFKDDIDAARDAISRETTSGRNVVVIAHSYGGMVGNSAIKGFTKPREDSPFMTSNTSTGYVVGLILIASGFTLTGLAFMDPFFGHPPPSWRINKETGYAELVIPPRELFYHDLPVEEADYWASQLTTQSLKALFEGGEFAYAGWQDVPVWYIGTVEDRGLPVAVQRLQVGMARQMGGDVVHRELQASHSPFLSMPQETAEIVVSAVEAFMGRSVERVRGSEEVVEGRKGMRILVPAVRIWQPLTWFRFGLPLLFGHMIGRGILTFGWVRRLWSSW